MKNILLTFMLTMLFGCSLYEKFERCEAPRINKGYLFSYTDHPQEKKMSIEIQSNSSFPMCMTNSTWPSHQGQLDGAAQRVFIVVNGKRYPYKNYEMNYCPFRECAIEVTKRNRVQGDIFYKDFHLPEEIYDEPKELIFDAEPFWCAQGEWMD